MGDLDLAIMGPELNEIPAQVKHDFPIVDWCGLDYFIVPSENDFLDQLIRCEKMYAESNTLSKEQLRNISHIVESAAPLWGEPKIRQSWNNYDTRKIPFLPDKPIPSLYLYPPALHR